MRWGRYPFTNILGERSIKLKPEGMDFEILGDASGVRIKGESHIMNTNEELSEFAKSVATAYQFYESAMREKHGLRKKKEDSEPKKLILPDSVDKN